MNATKTANLFFLGVVGALLLLIVNPTVAVAEYNLSSYSETTAPASPSTTFYLCIDDSTYQLSTSICISNVTILAGLTEIRFTTELSESLVGKDYDFAITMATEPEGASPSIDAKIILDQGGQETVLASTNFIVDNYRGDSPPYDYQLYTASVTGLEFNASQGYRLIVSLENNGLGTMIVRANADDSSITIKEPVTEYMIYLPLITKSGN